MKLPYAEQAVIPPEKVRDYLLSFSQPVGRYKAAFFAKLGYTQDNWERLATDLRLLLTNEASVKERTAYGQKFEVRGHLTGPAQTGAEVVTAWIILGGENVPRFVTAYPGERR